jgi:hypothetical protein
MITTQTSSEQLQDLFFKELKKYNSTNFRDICKANLESTDEEEFDQTCKAFSSAITRYNIFKQKHPEIDRSLMLMLYYKLKLDVIAKYFTVYPDSPVKYFEGFQQDVKSYNDKVTEVSKDEEDEEYD